jgi:NitT/TauT family transport system substrate-binding protein
MDESFIERARMLGARMQALKVIERQPDYNRLFDLQFIQKIKAELNH